MSLFIGDVIWNRQGQPALVTNKDPKKGTVHVDENLKEKTTKIPAMKPIMSASTKFI